MEGRGEARRVLELRRLPNGHFAPKGQGEMLRAGDRVRVPHPSGVGMASGKVVEHQGQLKVKVSSGPESGNVVPVATKVAADAGHERPKGPQGGDLGAKIHAKIGREPAKGEDGPADSNGYDDPDDPEEPALGSGMDGGSFSQAKLDKLRAETDKDAAKRRAAKDKRDAKKDLPEPPHSPGTGEVESKFGAGGSPGRGPTGKLRNFKAMSPAKLKQTISDLQDFGKDPEALSAIKAVAKDKGVAWNDKPKPSAAAADGPLGHTASGMPVHVSQSSSGGFMAHNGDGDKLATGATKEEALSKAMAYNGGAQSGAMGPNKQNLSLKDMPLGTTFQMNDGSEYILHKAVGDPFFIVKPTDGGKAKPLHKMFAPAQVGPIAPGYDGSSMPEFGPSSKGDAPTAPGADGQDDLFADLSKSVDIAKAAKAKGEDPAAALKSASAAEHAKPASKSPKGSALDAYLKAGGNDPAVIKALQEAARQLEEVWSPAARMAALRARQQHAHTWDRRPDTHYDLNSARTQGGGGWSVASADREFHTLTSPRAGDAPEIAKRRARVRSMSANFDRSFAKDVGTDAPHPNADRPSGEFFDKDRAEAAEHLDHLRVHHGLDPVNKKHWAKRMAEARELREDWATWDAKRKDGIHGVGHVLRNVFQMQRGEHGTADPTSELHRALGHLKKGQTAHVPLPEGEMKVTHLGRHHGMSHFHVEGGGHHVDPDLRRGPREIPSRSMTSQEMAERVKASVAADFAHTAEHTGHVLTAKEGAAHHLTSIDGHSGTITRKGSKFVTEGEGIEKSTHPSADGAVRHLKRQMRAKHGAEFLDQGHDSDPLSTESSIGLAKAHAAATARNPETAEKAKSFVEKWNPDGAPSDIFPDKVAELAARNPATATQLTGREFGGEAAHAAERAGAHMPHPPMSPGTGGGESTLHTLAPHAAHVAHHLAPVMHHVAPIAHHVIHLLNARIEREQANVRRLEEAGATDELLRARARLRVLQSRVP